jgi:nicotinamide-nucleotide amidase
MKMFSQSILNLAENIVKKSIKNNIKISTSESCTGGLIIAALTDIPGSSAIIDRGFITYTNQAKIEMLHVKESTLCQYGAVSEQVTAQMAQGARIKSKSDITIAVSGIAGPDGGSAEKPVGLVYISLSTTLGNISIQGIFKGDRSSIRLQTVEKALTMIYEKILEIENNV